MREHHGALLALLLTAALLLAACGNGGGSSWAAGPGSAFGPGGDPGSGNEQVTIGDETVSRQELQASAAQTGVSEQQALAMLENHQAADAYLSDALTGIDPEIMSPEEREAEALALVRELSEEQLIVPGSAEYDPENGVLSFELAEGGRGMVRLAEMPEDCICFGVGGGQGLSAHPTAAVQELSAPSGIAARNGEALRVHALYCFIHDKNREVFRQLHDEMFDQWRQLGIEVTEDREVTLDDLCSLEPCDVTIICTHGTEMKVDDSDPNVYSGIMVDQRGGPAVNCRYLRQLYRNHVQHYWTSVNGKYVHFYAVSAGFFEDIYKANSLDGLFLVECCMFFGCDHRSARVDESFARVLVDKGADCVIGFHNTVLAHYAIPLLRDVLASMQAGSTAREAVEAAKKTHGDTDESEYQTENKHKFKAYPCICGQKDYRLARAEMPTVEPQDPEEAAYAFLRSHDRIRTDLYPYADEFIISAWALTDLSGDGVPELLLETEQDSYFSGGATGLLICLICDDGTMEPAAYFDLDAVFQEVMLEQDRWLVLSYHGTGGSGEARYVTLYQNEVLVGEMVQEDDEHDYRTHYYMYGLELDKEGFEDELLLISGWNRPGGRELEFTPLAWVP